MKKKILIMSVYAPSDYNSQWYKLQKQFISKNTQVPYDFKIITNNVSKNFFSPDDVVLENPENIGHPAAVRQIINYMSNHDEYTSFLLLDSDSFPVWPAWHSILDEQMSKFSKNIAAPIRFENLDLFPHPCVVYMDRHALENNYINFDYEKVGNLVNDQINEVGGNMIKVADKVLPLLRTNMVNLHPVAAGIYHHLFYHHGAGSRGFGFRVTREYDYYPHWINLETETEYGDALMECLLNDPVNFIDKLLHGY